MEWSESQVVERFLTLSPQAQELQARVSLTEAEAKTRTVYPNPTVSYSREGAGYNQFFEASLTLPLNGRTRYLRDAGAAAVSVADANREAALWGLRTDLLQWLPELDGAPADLAEAVDLATSFEAWDRLRGDRQLSVKVAVAVMDRMVLALVPDSGHKKRIRR